jgi:hypothetical protein
MGWLDKGFKNLVKGARDTLKGPGGIMLLSAAAPWLAASAGPWAASLASKYPMLAKMGASPLGKLATGAMKSPWVKNALTNAAMQGGIAALTGSKHPWKAMGYSALASMPFTALQSAQAANAFNKANNLTGTDSAASWYDMALGKDLTIPSKIKIKDLPYGSEMIDDVSFEPSMSQIEAGYEIPQIERQIIHPHYKETVIPAKTFENISKSPGIDMSYFTNPGQAELAASNPGILGLGALAGDLDLMASVVPQIAGMYGGRMTDEEKWIAAKEKQIQMWAFQFGIPIEEAREIWKDGYRNPYYQTQTPEDYGDIMFANRGGHIYKDDYTAGGKAVGPGGPKDDAIRPVALSDDEFVFTAEASNNFPGGHEGLYALMNSLDPESERPEEARERIV